MKRVTTMKTSTPRPRRSGAGEEPARARFEAAGTRGAPTACAATPGRFDQKSILVLGLLLTAFLSLQLLLPLSTALQIGGDEGFELSKAMLYLKGYKFYTEVWNDQPLLHTFLAPGAPISPPPNRSNTALPATAPSSGEPS